MANGEWRMANGEWRMANGEWRMANGEWRKRTGAAAPLSYSPFAICHSLINSSQSRGPADYTTPARNKS
jgi:hypothetical protein